MGSSDVREMLPPLAMFVAVRRPRTGVLLFLLYLVNLLFAWTYNVGDVHVFFLPSHYIIALCAGAGVAAVARALKK